MKKFLLILICLKTVSAGYCQKSSQNDSLSKKSFRETIVGTGSTKFIRDTMCITGYQVLRCMMAHDSLQIVKQEIVVKDSMLARQTRIIASKDNAYKQAQIANGLALNAISSLQQSRDNALTQRDKERDDNEYFKKQAKKNGKKGFWTGVLAGIGGGLAAALFLSR